MPQGGVVFAWPCARFLHHRCAPAHLCKGMGIYAFRSGWLWYDPAPSHVCACACGHTGTLKSLAKQCPATALPASFSLSQRCQPLGLHLQVPCTGAHSTAASCWDLKEAKWLQLGQPVAFSDPGLLAPLCSPGPASTGFAAAGS